ncbi:MAG: hypothetical protein HC861_07645 [Rhodospirillaceae bacterium]|nr:hypothetical protein [Rhodospirillaceae bacterium]
MADCEPHDPQLPGVRSREDRRQLILVDEVGRQEVRAYEQDCDGGSLNGALDLDAPFVTGLEAGVLPYVERTMSQQRSEMNLQSTQPFLIPVAVAYEQSLCRW